MYLGLVSWHLLANIQENICQRIIIVLQDLIAYKFHFLIKLLKYLCNYIIILFNKAPSWELQTLRLNNSSNILYNISQCIIIIVWKRHIGLSLSYCFENHWKLFMIIFNLLLLNLLTDLLGKLFLFNRFKFIVNNLIITFCCSMPGFNYFHSRCYVVVKRKDFFELSDEWNEKMVIFLKG